MKVAIVHYHLQPGGVTRVVERAIRALGPRANCLVFSGEKPADDSPLRDQTRVVPGIGYDASGSGHAIDLPAAARNAFGSDPDVWHIHNHSLGKNPALTRETIRLAKSGHRILLQIHDFAEDGRPANYRALAPLQAHLYPVANHVHYAVLNQRDQSHLRSTGIPEEAVHLLPNAIEELPAKKTQPSRGDPFIVYPCRAIRRKNIGELLLWSALMPHARFAVTLAPLNPDVKPIYEAWRAFAAELSLPVEFNAGATVPFEELLGRATALINVSIAEGFGLAFLEPWMAGRPLTGRNLPEITADFAEQGLDLSALYDELPVPLVCGSTDLRGRFDRTLEVRLRAVMHAYGRPWDASIPERTRAALVHDGRVDFGRLDESMQRRLIRALIQHPDEVQVQLGDASGAVSKNRRIVQKRYGLESYGERLASLYQTLAGTVTGPVCFADGRKLLDEFLAPHRINLLRT